MQEDDLSVNKKNDILLLFFMILQSIIFVANENA